MTEEKAKTLLNLLKRYWWIAAIVFIVIFFWPLVTGHTMKGWQKFSAWSTYAYAVITAVTLFIIIAAAYFTWKQIQDNTNTRKLNMIFELWKYRSSEEMYKAIQTVWNTEWDIIKNDEKLSHYRRIVSHYHHMEALAVKEGLIGIDFLYSRYGRSAVDIWDIRLRNMELEVRKEIERNNLRRKLAAQGKNENEINGLIKVNEQKIVEAAIYHVDEELPTAWLSREWKKRFPTLETLVISSVPASHLAGIPRGSRCSNSADQTPPPS